MVPTLLETADAAAADGVSAEVIDLRTLSPFDDETVAASVRRTGRAVVVHEASGFAGFGAEVAARLTEQCFHHLHAPIGRVTGFDIPYPPPKLEEHHLPAVDRILDADRPAAVRRHGGAAVTSSEFLLPDLGEGLTDAEIVAGWSRSATPSRSTSRSSRSRPRRPRSRCRPVRRHGDRGVRPAGRAGAGRLAADPGQRGAASEPPAAAGRRRGRSPRSTPATCWSATAPRQAPGRAAPAAQAASPASADRRRRPAARPPSVETAGRRRPLGRDRGHLAGGAQAGPGPRHRPGHGAPPPTRPASFAVAISRQSPAEPAAAADPRPAVERIPLTGLRGLAAERLTRSRREIPEATVWVDVDATALLAARRGAERGRAGPSGQRAGAGRPVLRAGPAPVPRAEQPDRRPTRSSCCRRSTLVSRHKPSAAWSCRWCTTRRR